MGLHYICNMSYYKMLIKNMEDHLIFDLLFTADNLYSKILLCQFCFCPKNTTKGSFAEVH